jgi:hypothetical protein
LTTPLTVIPCISSEEPALVFPKSAADRLFVKNNRKTAARLKEKRILRFLQRLKFLINVKFVG